MSTPLTPQAVLQDQRRVDFVRVVVHTLGPAGPTISDNHWSIYLLLAEGQGSVRMNMRADPGYMNGTLAWTKQAYLLTQSAIRHWDFSCRLRCSGSAHCRTYSTIGSPEIRHVRRRIWLSLLDVRLTLELT